MKTESLKVAVRVRPTLSIDSSVLGVVQIENNQIEIKDRGHFLQSSYDLILGPQSTQIETYGFVSESIQNIFKGVNCTIFAYGQTGSGKTYTMFGDQCAIGLESQTGIVPRAIQSLFEQANTFSYYCSFLQIYNERLYDLLQDPQRQKPLNIREDRYNGIYVENLAEFIVQNDQDCQLILEKGERNRAVRSTRFNNYSSRSHTIFQLLIESDQVNKRGQLVKSKLNLCDLAGSEKFDKENSMVRDHVSEMNQINKSLVTLGKVISCLSTQEARHIPYRESKLTRLLQDSLGVNTRTILIATIAPNANFVAESINTLKFADRAKQIMVRIKKNEIKAADNELVSRLQREVQFLKEILQSKQKGGIDQLQQELLQLKQENQLLRQSNDNDIIKEVERLKSENKTLRIELQSLQTQSTEPSFFITENNRTALAPQNRSMESIEKDDNLEKIIDTIRQQNIRKAGDSMKSQLVQSGRCPICTLKIPCKHYSTTDLLPKSESFMSQTNTPASSEAPSSRQRMTPRNRSAAPAQRKRNEIPRQTLPSNINIRYRGKSSTEKLESGRLEEIRLQQERKKQLKQANLRLRKLAQIQEYKEKRMLQEMEQLENKRVKEQQELERIKEEKQKREKYMDKQKQKLETYYQQKQAENMKLMQKKQQEERKRQIQDKKRKVVSNLKHQKVSEYHKTKQMIEQMINIQVEAIQSDTVKRSSSLKPW